MPARSNWAGFGLAENLNTGSPMNDDELTGPRRLSR
jgi:hypothetical protein